MLRITIEVLSHGDTTNPKHLGTALIINDCTGTAETGNYTITLSKWGSPKEIWKSGKLSGFPRLKLGPWDLLLLALIATIGDRMIKDK